MNSVRFDCKIYLQILNFPYKMSAMENRDEVLQMLERFTRLKQKEIPRELEDYLSFVARTGDTVYPWPAVKYFFRTKLSLVIMDFHDNTPSIADLPQCPNVDPFCYDRMRRTLMSRMDSFNSAPFTIQRICELLNEPRKHYTRIDKFMRAVEKNILVVSTQEPGRRRSDSENGDSLDSIVNGDLEVNVDIEMDNEAFGVDSSEMVTNATAAATEAVIPAITTPARAEELPPMESSEDQEQETENHEPETVPEVAPTDNGVEVREANDEKTEEVLPKEVKESDKNASGPEEEAADQTEKLLYPDDVEPTSPDASAPPESKQKALSKKVVDSAGTDVVEPKEQNEEAPAQESHDTCEPIVTEKSPAATAPETDIDPIDDGEPKAKMAKLSQEEPESETADPKPTSVPAEKAPADPDKDTVSSESTTDSNGSSVEYVESNNSPEERTEPGVSVLLSSSVESLVSNVAISSDEVAKSGEILPSSSSGSTIISDVDISPDEVSSTEVILPSAASDSTLPESSSVCSTVLNPVPLPEQESKPVELERPATETATDEPATAEQTSEAPSKPPAAAAAAAEPVAYIAEETEETIVKRISLEAIAPPAANEPEQPTEPRVTSDDMETLSSAAAVPENVMATDEEEQPVVPMAADASETAPKPDENAMDIDESSVEPMDQ